MARKPDLPQHHPFQLKRQLVCGKVDYSLVYNRTLLGIQGILALVYQSFLITTYHLQKMEQGLHKNLNTYCSAFKSFLVIPASLCIMLFRKE